MIQFLIRKTLRAASLWIQLIICWLTPGAAYSSNWDCSTTLLAKGRISLINGMTHLHYSLHPLGSQPFFFLTPDFQLKVKVWSKLGYGTVTRVDNSIFKIKWDHHFASEKFRIKGSNRTMGALYWSWCGLNLKFHPWNKVSSWSASHSRLTQVIYTCNVWYSGTNNHHLGRKRIFSMVKTYFKLADSMTYLFRNPWEAHRMHCWWGLLMMMIGSSILCLM